MILAAAVAACGGSSTPAQVSSPSPSPHVPGGLVNGPRCGALRAQIQANVQTLQLEQTSGQTAEAQQTQAQIDASLTAARAIPGCDVSDLVPH